MTTDGMELEDLAPETRERLEALTREGLDRLRGGTTVETAAPKVVEIVAYQCVECGRKHVERRDAERCCRCLRCRAAKLDPGSVGYCRDCAAIVHEEMDEDDEDDWLDIDDE